nr:hypothetical protein [uncultured Cohaesibacter sp.]
MPAPIQHGSAVIVDENTFQRKLLRSILRSSGFSCVAEFDKFEFGLDEAKRTFANFLFLDYDTATNSDILRGRPEIRNTHLGEATYLIILLENPTRYRVNCAIAHGAHWVISRPFSTNALNNRLHAVMNPAKLETTASISKFQQDKLSKQPTLLGSIQLDPISLQSVTTQTNHSTRDDFFEVDMMRDYDDIIKRKQNRPQSSNSGLCIDEEADQFLI